VEVAHNQAEEIRHDKTGIVFRPGLEGVPATQSAICDIDGQRGRLSYRGYALEELAVKSTFLETTYLLIWGELPTSQQLRDFEEEVQMHRRVSFRVRDMMKCFPASGHPMDALQSSAAFLGLFYSRRAIDDPQYIYDAVVRLIAKIPTMVAAFQLIRKGQDPIQPRDDLAYSANFLYMLTEREPDPLAARIFDRCLMLHAEHSLNASTFSARVTASTLTDPYAVVYFSTVRPFEPGFRCRHWRLRKCTVFTKGLLSILLRCCDVVSENVGRHTHFILLGDDSWWIHYTDILVVKVPQHLY